MARLSNYIPDLNPFHLAGPPSWFLSQLWEFDDSLVIVPSRQGFYYRLAQKRPLQLAEHVVNEALFKESDTQMLAGYSLVPVTTILSTANWGNPILFEELRKRAPWRMGGAAKVTAMIEDQEKNVILDKQAKIDGHLTDLSKDAWKYYNMKLGLRTSLYSHKAAPHMLAQSSAAIIPRTSKPYQPLVITSWGNPHT